MGGGDRCDGLLNKASPAGAGSTGRIGRQHLSHSIDAWAPFLRHHLQTQAHQISGQAKSAGATIQRQIHSGLSGTAMHRRRLPIKANPANRSDILLRVHQHKLVGVGQPLKKSVVVI